MRGAAQLLDMGSPAVSISEEVWTQCLEIDWRDWLAEKGVKIGDEVIEWGGFKHRAP